MDEIYDAYYDKLYYWALKKTDNKLDAEDLTNSVFLAIFEYLNKNIKVEKIENLIWKIAYNLWCTRIKEYKKEKRNTIFKEEQQKLEEEMLDKIIYKEIIDNLNSFHLTSNEKKAFQMYYFKDYSIKEIGKLLNKKETSIKYYLYCARNKIKENYYE